MLYSPNFYLHDTRKKVKQKKLSDKIDYDKINYQIKNPNDRQNG